MIEKILEIMNICMLKIVDRSDLPDFLDDYAKSPYRALFIKEICKRCTDVGKIKLLESNHDLDCDNINDLVLSLKSIPMINNIIDFFVSTNSLSSDAENHIIDLLCKKINECNISFHNFARLFSKNFTDEQFLKFIDNFDGNYLVLSLKLKSFIPYYDLILSKFFERYRNINYFEVLSEGIYFSDKQIYRVLDKMFEENDIDSLILLINCETIDKKYFSYIVNGLKNKSLTFKKLDNIDLSNLEKDDRLTIIAWVCLNSSKEIYSYSKKDLYEEELEFIANKLCELKDKEILIQMMQNDKYQSFYNSIFETIMTISNITYDDISNINIDYLNDDNKILYIDNVIKMSDIESLSKFAVENEQYLTEPNIDDITEKICKCKDASIVYYYASSIKKLSSDNISILSKTISNINDIEYIYLFLKNIKNIKEEDKRELKSKILNSYNMKYICLLALYIDTKLIEKLFKNIYEMYEYMVLSKMYNKEEIDDINVKVYNNRDIKDIELKAKEEIGKINRKMYIMPNDKNSN